MVGQGVRALAYGLLRGQLLLQPCARPLIYLRTLTHIPVGLEIHMRGNKTVSACQGRGRAALCCFCHAPVLASACGGKMTHFKTVKFKVGGRPIYGCNPSL